MTEFTDDGPERPDLATDAEALGEIAVELGLDDAAEEIRAQVQRRLGDGRLRVAVLGEIKHGKSSLINAILGRPLVPVGVTPTTAAPVLVREGERRERRLLCADGPTDLDADRFDAIARGKETVDGLLELIEPGIDLPQGLELIDTPGFNDIDRFRSTLSRAELPRADALVLVLDATQVLSRTELALLRDAVDAVGGLQGSGATLELVINRIDLIAPSDRAEIVQHVKEQLADVLPLPIEPLLTDARGALADPDSARPEVVAVRTLRERLHSLAAARRQILPERLRAVLGRHARLLSYNAAIQARALALDDNALREEIAALEGSLDDAITDLDVLRAQIGEGESKVLVAIDERLARFRTQLEEHASAQIERSDLSRLTHVVPGAIQDAFLDFVHAESDRVRDDLDALTREILKTHGELARRRLVESTLHLGFTGPSVYVEPPSVTIEAGMIALGIVGTAVMYLGSMTAGLVMTIASPLTTMALRAKSLRDAKRQARESLPTALDRTMARLHGAIQGVVATHARELVEHLTLADRAITTQLLATLERARKHRADYRRDDANEEDDGRSSIEATRAALTQVESRLEGIILRLERANGGTAGRPDVLH